MRSDPHHQPEYHSTAEAEARGYESSDVSIPTLFKFGVYLAIFAMISAESGDSMPTIPSAEVPLGART